jgi:oligoribonuclease
VIVWCDIETTGLDAYEDEILEVAFIVTGDRLELIDQLATVVAPRDNHWVTRMKDDVLLMHQNSGLFDAVLRAQHDNAPDIESVDDTVANFLHHTCGAVKLPLGGSSVHFDRGFMERHMPLTTEALHYRNIDISTIKELLPRWRPDIPAWQPRGKKTHRAIDDIRATLAEAQHYMEEIFQA